MAPGKLFAFSMARRTSILWLFTISVVSSASMGNQELTREWWAHRRTDYDLFISEVVVREAAIGDSELARQRVAICDDLPLLAISSWTWNRIGLCSTSSAWAKTWKICSAAAQTCSRQRAFIP